MNSIMSDTYPLFDLYQAMRGQLMALLKESDLSFTPGGSNPTLGSLCRGIGEVERAYIESFKTFKIDFLYRNTTPQLENSMAQLTAWFAEMDSELKTTVEGLSQAEVDERQVDRGGSFRPPLRVQLAIYQEALLIFYGKVMVYLHAMGITPSEQMQDWLE